MIIEVFKSAKRLLSKPEGLSLKSLSPVSRFFGTDRGTPIDRFYIEKFLFDNRRSIGGCLLEIADDKYSRKFGSNVKSFEVLHVEKTKKATIIGDLSAPDTLPQGGVDCFICTQTFHCIYDFGTAIKGAYGMLAPGGVLLATVPGISQVSRYDMERWGDYWRFTYRSAIKSFESVFGFGNVTVSQFGNCFAATSLLRGLCVEEINSADLLHYDVDYPVTLGIVAQKKL